MEQRRADELLELLHARGDHRLGDAHVAGRLRKALRLGDTHEGFDGKQAVHGAANPDRAIALHAKPAASAPCLWSSQPQPAIHCLALSIFDKNGS